MIYYGSQTCNLVGGDIFILDSILLVIDEWLWSTFSSNTLE